MIKEIINFNTWELVTKCLTKYQTYSNVLSFSNFLQLARSVHHRDPRELVIGFEGLSYVVIGFPTAYGVFGSV